MASPQPLSYESRASQTDRELRNLSNEDLIFQVKLATRGERAMTLRVLHRLNEIERRRLYLELGYSSLFDYCVRCLKYPRRLPASPWIWLTGAGAWLRR